LRAYASGSQLWLAVGMYLTIVNNLRDAIELNVKPLLGFTLPWAGVTPAPKD